MKENPFETLDDEHSYRLACLTEFSSDSNKSICWNKLKLEVNYMNESLNFKDLVDFYRELFQPTE